MAKLEYLNSIVSMAMESTEGYPIDLKSKEFDNFLQAVYNLHAKSPLKTIILLQDSNEIYDFKIETKEGAKCNYLFSYENNEFNIQVTTEGTWWSKSQEIFEKRYRDYLFVIILKFNIVQLEILFI